MESLRALCVWSGETNFQRVATILSVKSGSFSSNQNIFSFTVNMFCWNQVNGSTISYSKLVTVKQSWAMMKILQTDKLKGARPRIELFWVLIFCCFSYWAGLNWYLFCRHMTGRASLRCTWLPDIKNVSNCLFVCTTENFRFINKCGGPYCIYIDQQRKQIAALTSKLSLNPSDCSTQSGKPRNKMLLYNFLNCIVVLFCHDFLPFHLL